MSKRVFPIAEARKRLSALIKQAQTAPIIITNHGRPVAAVIGIEDTSLEDLLNMGTDAILRAALNKKPPAATPSGDPPDNR